MFSEEPLIHVGILSDVKVNFILRGNYLYNGSIYFGEKTVKYAAGKLKFENCLYSEITFEPQDEHSYFDLLNVTIGINFHWERRETQQFRGTLRFSVIGSQITAINCIRTEDYLLSVISSEMSARASTELLKAHAVISRSWLLAPLMVATRTGTTVTPTETRTELPDKTLKIVKWYERNAHTGFDVCADDHCQRYQGITKASTEKVAKAIEETRGLVLMSGNEICDARFSKSCGGATETFENCWAPEHFSYLEKIYDNDNQVIPIDLSIEENAQKWIRQSPEAFCNTSDANILSQVLNNFDQETTDFYRWKTEYTQNQLSDLIAKKSGLDIGSIIDITPVKRGESGRIVELKITGTKRTVVVGKELEIRKWLSESHLYSSAFVIDKKFGTDDQLPERFILTGAGWGHGVGLCQIGAAVMGEKGYDFSKILQHYFKSAELKKLY